MANSNPLRCRSINIYLELNTAPNASISPVQSRPPMDFRREKKESPAEERNEDLDCIRGQLDRLATDKNQMAFSGRHTKRTD